MPPDQEQLGHGEVRVLDDGGPQQEDEKPQQQEEAKPEEQAAQADPLERAIEELARRDRELLQVQANLKANQQYIEEYKQLRELAGTDPLAALRRIGGDPMAAAEHLLAGRPQQAELPPEIKSISDGLAEVRQMLANQQQERAQSEEMARIRNAIMAAGDQHPTLRALADEGNQVVVDIFQRAVDEYTRTQRVPNYADLFANAEKEYTDGIIASLQQVIGISSMRERLQQLLSEEKPTQPPLSQPGADQKVLSEKLGGEARHETRKETEQEARAAALQIISEAMRPQS